MLSYCTPLGIQRDVVRNQRKVFVGGVTIMLSEVFADGCADGHGHLAQLLALPAQMVMPICTLSLRLKGIVLGGVLVVQSIKGNDDIRSGAFSASSSGQRDGGVVNIARWQLLDEFGVTSEVP